PPGVHGAASALASRPRQRLPLPRPPPRGAPAMTATTLPDTVRTQAFIDGEFTDALDHATFDSLAPATGNVIAHVTAGGEAAVDRTVRAARAPSTRGDWSRLAPADSKNVLLRFADLIEAHGEELAFVEAIDAG